MQQPDGKSQADPRILANARALRREMTVAERKLWAALRDRRAEFKFRRQHPYGVYVLDFFCHDVNVVVELDGWFHDGSAEYDLARQRSLETAGLVVVRIANEDVLKDAVQVAQGIYDLCAELRSRNS